MPLRVQEQVMVFGCSLLLLAAMAAPKVAHAQQLEPVGENLLRLEGTDAQSGIHYLKLILLLNAGDAPKAPDVPTAALAGTMPRFTMECREQAGKRSLHWLLRFEGSSDFDFQGPVVATPERPHPVPNPSAELTMRFEGYMRSQQFKRQWEVLPTGELHYRNSGFHSSNMDDPRYFLQWLGSLPDLRIGYAKPSAAGPKELVFPTKKLLELVRKSELCQP